MIIVNNRRVLSILNYKAGGVSKRLSIAGGESLNVPELVFMDQILNKRDFRQGFFSVKEEKKEEYRSLYKEVISKLGKGEEENKDVVAGEVVVQGALDILLHDDKSSLEKAEGETKEYKEENKIN